MAKKKNTSKKHKFKHVESAQPAQQAQQSVSAGTSQPAAVSSGASNSVKTSATQRDFGYVKRDVRRIGILAGSLVALELGLYYVLVHTSVGSTVYSWVKL